MLWAGRIYWVLLKKKPKSLWLGQFIGQFKNEVLEGAIRGYGFRKRLQILNMY